MALQFEEVKLFKSNLDYRNRELEYSMKERVELEQRLQFQMRIDSLLGHTNGRAGVLDRGFSLPQPSLTASCNTDG
eukprot:2788462-Rhodomonas_salina.1